MKDVHVGAEVGGEETMIDLGPSHVSDTPPRKGVTAGEDGED